MVPATSGTAGEHQTPARLIGVVSCRNASVPRVGVSAKVRPPGTSTGRAGVRGGCGDRAAGGSFDLAEMRRGDDEGPVEGEAGDGIDAAVRVERPESVPGLPMPASNTWCAKGHAGVE